MPTTTRSAPPGSATSFPGTPGPASTSTARAPTTPSSPTSSAPTSPPPPASATSPACCSAAPPPARSSAWATSSPATPAPGSTSTGPAGAGGNFIQGNRIGTDLAGTTKLANATGILLDGGTTLNQIGGNSAAGLGNLISGNPVGIHIDGTGNTRSNLVYGNRIGTTLNGLAALDPVGPTTGILLDNGTTLNQIGGGGPGQGNVISGNATYGVHVATASSNDIVANLIGLSPDSTTAVANGLGVLIDGASTKNNVGKAGAGLGNVISNNATDGVRLTAGAFQNAVRNDTIAANKNNGVQLSGGANRNTVDADVITGNKNDGVLITGSGTSGNDLTGNVVAANTLAGVHVAAQAGTNHVGLAGGPANQNQLYGNLQNGVLIEGVGTTGNTVR